MADPQQTALSKPYGGSLDQLGKVESARQGRQLQEVLLDSVIHEQRTRLTSINTCVTALLTIARLGPSERNELLTIINEESDRLNYLERARLDIGEIINLDPHAIEETIDAAKKTAGRCSAHIQFRRRFLRGCRFAVQYCEQTEEISVEKSTFVDSSTAKFGTSVDSCGISRYHRLWMLPLVMERATAEWNVDCFTPCRRQLILGIPSTHSSRIRQNATPKPATAGKLRRVL
jgi:hypothetical protein